MRALCWGFGLVLASVSACGDDGSKPAGDGETAETAGSGGSGGTGGTSATGGAGRDAGGEGASDERGGSGGQGGSDGQGATGGMASDGGSAGSVPVDNECDGWAQDHPDWLWCDDFDDGVPLGDKYPDVGLTGLTVDDADAWSGPMSLHQRYDGGQVDAGWVSFFYGDTLGGDYGPVQDEIYLRWYHKFEGGFQPHADHGLPPKMARITSIGPGWDKRFGVYYWVEGDEIVADVSAPYSSQANSSGWLPLERSGFHFTSENLGRWICHEMHVKANTPGQSDGAYTFWVDGVVVVERTGVDLVGSTDFHYNNAMLDAYWNGGSPAAQSRYYDNMVVATSRIGCGG